MFDLKRSLDVSLQKALAISPLSFSGHVDGAAYFLALKTFFTAQTGLPLSSAPHFGGQLDVPTSCAVLLPQSLCSPAQAHLTKVSPGTMFLVPQHRLAYKEVVPRGFDDDGAAVEEAAAGDGADAVRPKSLPAGPASTLAVGAYLAALSQVDMTLGREDLTRHLSAADESVWRALGATFDLPCLPRRRRREASAP